MPHASTLTNRVVFLTGCASGIGLDLAKTFFQNGDSLIVTDIRFEELHLQMKQAGIAGERVLIRQLDVCQPEMWDRIMQETIQTFGKLDVMFNIAGFIKPGFIADQTTEDVNRHLDINTKGVIFGTLAAARVMQSHASGHIVNIASLAGVAPIPGIALYSAAKFAVRAYSIAAAQELKQCGISVTVICPDAVQAPMLDLQLDTRAAALVFSGAKPLTVEDIRQVILHKVLPHRPVEVLIPSTRGWLAKLANLFPSLSQTLQPFLIKRGLSQQHQLQGKRSREI
ncbi:MAG TPA: SDR family oxidoreductase [Acidobacteriota bacterium]|nr:SDR family oxidoreductase [Acidobacteriota bacterium]